MRSPLLASLAGLLSLVLGGCGNTPRDVAPSVATRPITLPDGGQLQVPERAVRILPMSAAAVDYVLALVPRERVAAIPEAAAIYAYSLQGREPWPADRMVASFAAEAMLAASPDLVIAHAWQTPVEALQIVESSGIPVLRLGDLHAIEDLYSTLQLVASAVDEPRAGAQLVANLRRRVEALQTGAEERASLRALSYTNFGSGGFSAGSQTTANILIQLTGMTNAGAEDAREGHFELDIERLLQLDPDVIVVSQSTPEYSASRGYLVNENALRSLRAVKRDWIVELPASLFSTNSQYLVDTAERLAADVDGLLEASR